jgi:carbon storage regulator
MLYITRKEGESIIVGEGIRITVMQTKGRSVKLGIDCPPGTQILREELYMRIQEENKQALLTAGFLGDLQE